MLHCHMCLQVDLLLPPVRTVWTLVHRLLATFQRPVTVQRTLQFVQLTAGVAFEG